MARKYSAEEVLELLDEEETGFDDPQEIIMDGNDEEFDDLDDLEECELENGNKDEFAQKI